MTTFKSYLDTLNNTRLHDIGIFSSNAMQEVLLTAKRMTGFNQQIHEAYQSISKIGVQINAPILDAIQHTQQLSQVISPDVYRAARVGMEFQNAVSIQFNTIAHSVYRIGFDIQPLLNELSSIAPTLQQIINLHQGVATLVEDIEFSNDIPEEICSLTLEDKRAASRAVSEIIAEPENWERALVKTFKAMKDSHPVLFSAIIYLLASLLTIVYGAISNVLGDTVKPAILRETPSPSSQTIIIIAPAQQVTVLDKVPYYFEIEYTDPNNGETYIGWASKRSVLERETPQNDTTEIEFQEESTTPHTQSEEQATASSIETRADDPNPLEMSSVDKIE